MPIPCGPVLLDVFGVEGEVEERYNWPLYASTLLKLSRIYGFWRYISSLERDETRELVSMTLATLPDHYREVLDTYVRGLGAPVVDGERAADGFGLGLALRLEAAGLDPRASRWHTEIQYFVIDRLVLANDIFL